MPFFLIYFIPSTVCIWGNSEKNINCRFRILKFTLVLFVQLLMLHLHCIILNYLIQKINSQWVRDGQITQLGQLSPLYLCHLTVFQSFFPCISIHHSYLAKIIKPSNFKIVHHNSGCHLVLCFFLWHFLRYLFPTSHKWRLRTCAAC